MDAKQWEAIENIKLAVDVNDSDTLASLSGDGQVLWTASGSWTGYKNVTLGDLRAIAAIAPPVAAGSVDTPEFCALLEFYGRMYPQGNMARTAQAKAAIIGSIDAWGAHQREAGEKKATYSMEKFFQVKHGLIERAEKAEDDVLYLKRTYAGLFDERTALEQRAEKAEARVKELEAEIEGLEFDIKYPGEEA